ncbi:MAG TPA: alpha/beta hydrolase [Pirellulales bacterium]|jgi:pimeloyl-ACP methyl ester carboxylesterase
MVWEGRDINYFLGGQLGFALEAPGYTVRDYNYSLEGQVFSEKHLFDQITNFDYKRIAGEFAVPMFVIRGDHDCSAPTELAKKYLDSIIAPRKAFVTVPGVGHFAMFIKSDEFLKELVARVRPLAVRSK